MRHSGSSTSRAARSSIGREIVVDWRTRPGRSGPSATRAAPVSVAKSTISSGLLLGRPGQRVGKDQPAFGVGVVDLDEQALARLDDVAGAEGRARHGILDRRDQQVKPHGQLLADDQPRQRERMRRAAHVLLHQPHAARPA